MVVCEFVLADEGPGDGGLAVVSCRSSWEQVEPITASRVPIVTLVDAASGLHVVPAGRDTWDA